MELQEASSLGKQPVLEPRLALHLHLQQHHRLLRRTALAAARPERTIETMVRRFQFKCS
jgi:hypothetical protein